MVFDFLLETYSAHSSLLDTIALIIMGITLFFGMFSAAIALDWELDELSC